MHNPADVQYANIITNILENGDIKGDRTGVGTKAVFGATARFDLSDGYIPILTTKRVYWKTAVKELLWFLTGDTNIRKLLMSNVSIWTDWPLKTYRDATGSDISQTDFEMKIIEDSEFAERWGDLGPVYGSVWRKWIGSNGKSYDQIAEIVSTLKNNPNSRRIILEGWKVDELDQMVLPPCHKTYQYQVTSDGKLNSIMYQRK